MHYVFENWSSKSENENSWAEYFACSVTTDLNTTEIKFVNSWLILKLLFSGVGKTKIW